MKNRILVAGGAGYIGSHTSVELVQRGFDVIVLDNFSNSSPKVMRHMKMVGAYPEFVNIDVRSVGLSDLMQKLKVESVIHFAAFKSVADSVKNPIEYFDNNVVGTINLIKAMRDAGVKNLVFSSSATVYGMPDSSPVRESALLQVANPYGRSKLICEQIISDHAASDDSFNAVILRYFNPIGAHPSGLLGEAQVGTPNNLMPYVCQVAIGKRPFLNVYGSDYETSDGTGVRDYIHVMDLAKAHVDAINYMTRTGSSLTANIGTGVGYSVLEVVSAFEQASGRRIPVRLVDRRPGDVAEYYADASMAKEQLGWEAQHGLLRMCEDAWRWQVRYPNGYS